jgi:hypothetical protein
MSTGAGALGALGAAGAAGAGGALGEVGEDGEAAFAAEAGAEEPSPVVTLGEAGEGAGAGAAGVPVGLSDALPGPPPRATAGPASDAVETFPIAPRAGPKSAGPPNPPPTAAPPTPGALPPEVGPVFAEVAVELPVPRVVFVGPPNSSPVSAEMLLRAACA